MRRRDLLALAAGTVALRPFTGAAQQKPTPVIGVLYPNSREQWGTRTRESFEQGMRSLGWIVGKTVSIEYRFANGDPALLSANAADLVAQKVDLIVALSGFAAQAARAATSTIPIVMDAGDPVGMGLVASLARPSGNVTGLSWMSSDLVAKQLEVFKEAVPQVNKIAVLLQSDYLGHAQQMTALERAASMLGVSVLPVDIISQDLPRQFDEITTAGGLNGYFLTDSCSTTGLRTNSNSWARYWSASSNTLICISFFSMNMPRCLPISSAARLLAAVSPRLAASTELRRSVRITQ
jgi:putative ABC transport system substrate-binding protein